ncbi:hypothetical protein IW262DRAFT_1293626 [Armillaria fumosa]|nr:hypothetical protein IW262DRAFT_1293626 [Armillaria fumosa]
MPSSQSVASENIRPSPLEPHARPSTLGVVNDAWELHLEWVHRSFMRSQLVFMGELVGDMIEAQRCRNMQTLQGLWCFVYEQFEDLYPIRDWVEWRMEDNLTLAGMQRCTPPHVRRLSDQFHNVPRPVGLDAWPITTSSTMAVGPVSPSSCRLGLQQEQGSVCLLAQREDRDAGFRLLCIGRHLLRDTPFLFPIMRRGQKNQTRRFEEYTLLDIQHRVSGGIWVRKVRLIGQGSEGVHVDNIDCKLAGPVASKYSDDLGRSWLVLRSMTPAESENVSETGPDAQTLQNRAKSRAYYQSRLLNIIRGIDCHPHLRHRDAILEQRRSRKVASSSQPIPTSTDKQSSDPDQASINVKTGSSNLQFWLRRTGRLEQRFESLLGRRMCSEIKEDNRDLNEVTAYDCSKAQYIEHIYREFRFMFQRDGTYDDNHDSVFEARVDEMDTLNNEVACCTDAILNLDGYGAHYEKANTLAAAVTTVGGWVAELEIEAMSDPRGLIKLHRSRKLMYQT